MESLGVLWAWCEYSSSYYLVAMLTLTTSLVDLTDGLEVLLVTLQKMGIPTNAFVMVLVIAFKFILIFVGELGA